MTHEFGHLLGLGEDFEHEYATMYAYTAPGEIKKRVPSTEDLNQLLALYDADAADTDSGATGCAIATGNAGSAGFVLLGLGMFGLFAATRRRKRATTSFALAGSVLLMALPSLGDAPTRVGVAFEAELRVTSVSAHFEGGVIVSELALAQEDCAGECSAVPARIKAYGGSVGDLGQIVGHVATPQVGERVVMRAVDTEASGRQFEVAPLSVVAAQQKARSR
jgi:MYXO-CTERM domain-containing protein